MDTPTDELCSFSCKSECGKSSHCDISSSKCFPILECAKPTTYHLRSLSCSGPKDLELPEALLILYRAGIFSIDQSALTSTIGPKHRDELGIYWRPQQRKCQCPDHPQTSKAKPNRGLQAAYCKHFWTSSGIFLPVGAGIALLHS